MGKSRSAPAPQQITAKIDPFAQASADIAKDVFSETTPLRQSLTGQLTSGVQSPALQQANDLRTNLGRFLPQGTTIDPRAFGINQVGQLQTTDIGQIPTIGDLDLQSVLANADRLTVDPAFSPNFGALKSAAEQQFEQARRRAMESGATGGALTGALTQLEGDRALGMSGILGDLANRQAQARGQGLQRALGVGVEDLARQERGRQLQLGTSTADIERGLGVDRENLAEQQRIAEGNINRQLQLTEAGLGRGLALAGAQTDIDQRNIDRALNVATGGTAQALQGFGVGGNLAASAAATQAGLANAQAQRQAGAKSGAGQAIGQIGSAAIKKCWVAREVYGLMNLRWLMFREWLETKAPRWLDKIYTTYGESFALFIHDKPRTKNTIRFFMNKVIGGSSC